MSFKTDKQIVKTIIMNKDINLLLEDKVLGEIEIFLVCYYDNYKMYFLLRKG